MVHGGMPKNKFGTMPELCIFALQAGGLAHLVERLHGMQEVTGSIPVSSTLKARSCSGLLF